MIANCKIRDANHEANKIINDNRRLTIDGKQSLIIGQTIAFHFGENAIKPEWAACLLSSRLWSVGGRELKTRRRKCHAVKAVGKSSQVYNLRHLSGLNGQCPMNEYRPTSASNRKWSDCLDFPWRWKWRFLFFLIYSRECLFMYIMFIVISSYLKLPAWIMCFYRLHRRRRWEMKRNATFL